MKALSIGAAVLLLLAAVFALPVNPLWSLVSLAAAICSVATYFVFKKQTKYKR